MTTPNYTPAWAQPQPQGQQPYSQPQAQPVPPVVTHYQHPQQHPAAPQGGFAPAVYQPAAAPQAYGPPPGAPQPQYMGQQGQPPAQPQQAPTGYAPQYGAPAAQALGMPPAAQTWNGQPAGGPPQNDAQRAAFFASMMGGIGNANASGGRDYLRPGAYWVRIDEHDGGRTQMTGDACWVQQTVVKNVTDEGGQRPGEQVSMTYLRSKVGYLDRLKNYICSALGIVGADAKKVGEPECVQVFMSKTAFTGYVLEIRAYKGQTKGGAPITKSSYVRRVPDQEVLMSLDPRAKEAFFPGGLLERRIQLEQAAAAQAPR